MRAREIAAQQAGGLASTQSRQQAAAEVAEIERGLISLANTQVDGRYVFAGLATGAPPFTALDDPGFDPRTAYTGGADPFVVRTSDTTTTRLTTPGDQVFGSSLAAIDDLRLTLAAGNPPTASIDTVEQAAEVLRGERASVGGRARQLGGSRHRHHRRRRAAHRAPRRHRGRGLRGRGDRADAAPDRPAGDARIRADPADQHPRLPEPLSARTGGRHAGADAQDRRAGADR